MSLHDYVIDNANGAAVRLDFNNALAAIQSNNSNATSPTSTTPFMFWFDTTANEFKMRNAGDTAWNKVFDMTGANLIPFRNGTLLGDASQQTVGTAALINLPNVEDIQNQQGIYLLAGGAVNAFTLTLVPSIAGYVEGQRFVFKANLSITGGATLDVNAQGAGAITWPNGDALVPGDILAGQPVMVQRAATSFVMLGSRSIASLLQAEAGTQNTRIMTALRVKQSIDKFTTLPEIFTADGTYNVPAGVSFVHVTVIGGGGGGGGQAVPVSDNGGGGGGGGIAVGVIAVTPSGTLSVVVGVGGTAGAFGGGNGGAGGLSNVGGTKLVGNGGAGGIAGIGSSGAQGAGGTATSTEADSFELKPGGGGFVSNAGASNGFGTHQTSPGVAATKVGLGGGGSIVSNGTGFVGFRGLVIIIPVAT